jgi:hypothetical protein
MKLSSVLAAVVAVSCFVAAPSIKEDGTCRVESISMNRICKEWDGQWQGITVASDGCCYFSTSTHSRSHGAGFHRYNPETGEHVVLAEDMTIICGEKDTDSQQGKIHSPIVEHEGWLYFATHLSNYWPKGIERYPGAHVLGYEIATGRFRDLGIVKPRYSIYSAIDVDPERDLLYVFVVPFLDELIRDGGCFLYSIDIATGEKNELAQVTIGQRGTSFWFFVDKQGDCWFTLWKWHESYEHDRGNLYSYRVNTGEMETYQDVLPKGEWIDGRPVTDEKNLEKRSWTWARALPGREKCLFTMGKTGGGDERLWVFDPFVSIENGEAFRPLAYIGSTFLETALGGDRVYFIQYESLDDQRTQLAEANREKSPASLGFNDELHIRSVCFRPDADPKVVDHGAIIDQDGRRPRMINSLAADDKGRVYMMGSWYVNDYREASMQIMFSEHPGENIYRLVDRGEFFAVARTQLK